MSGASTAIAVSEMHRLAEKAVLQVRAELFRLQCSGEISVEKNGTFLKLTYCNKCLVTEPLGVLNILREIKQGGHADALWRAITLETTKHQECVKLRLYVMAVSILAIFLIMQLVLF